MSTSVMLKAANGVDSATFVETGSTLGDKVVTKGSLFIDRAASSGS